MAQLIPTPVAIADLQDIASDINTMNDGTTAREVQPRTRPQDNVIVEVTDDGHTDGTPVYYVQVNYLGEWRRSGAKYGEAKLDANGIDHIIVPAVVTA